MFPPTCLPPPGWAFPEKGGPYVPTNNRTRRVSLKQIQHVVAPVKSTVCQKRREGAHTSMRSLSSVRPLGLRAARPELQSPKKEIGRADKVRPMCQTRLDRCVSQG